MSDRSISAKPAAIAARCAIASRSFGIDISDITPEGCSALADTEWGDDGDFLHLKIADRIDVNGRVEWREGNRAGIRFFGQIHPEVVAQLARAAA